MRLSFKSTIYACYIGYFTQAVIVNLPPLFFLRFQTEFQISLTAIGLLISVNFFIQILTDLATMKFADKIGYRGCMIIAFSVSIIGICGLSVFPYIMAPYSGILLSTVFCAVGGGLMEVLVSPIINSLPSENKSQSMIFLHSFYCVGQVAVILISTLCIFVFSIDKWYVLPFMWALVPLVGLCLFMAVPMVSGESEHQKMSVKQLFKSKGFLLLIMVMICAGASELAMSQWASFFAEAGLKVSKTVGDLLGPCSFAVFMGAARMFFGSRGGALKLFRAMTLSCVLCFLSYLTVVFSPNPIISLLACSVCGLSVGIMWPAAVSISAEAFPRGGTAMFALLAFSGDIGCSLGPGIVGFVSDLANRGAEYGLKLGFLVTAIFPVLLFAGLYKLKKRDANLNESF